MGGPRLRGTTLRLGGGIHIRLVGLIQQPIAQVEDELDELDARVVAPRVVRQHCGEPFHQQTPHWCGGTNLTLRAADQRRGHAGGKQEQRLIQCVGHYNRQMLQQRLGQPVAVMQRGIDRQGWLVYIGKQLKPVYSKRNTGSTHHRHPCS